MFTRKVLAKTLAMIQGRGDGKGQGDPGGGSGGGGGGDGGGGGEAAEAQWERFVAFVLRELRLGRAVSAAAALMAHWRLRGGLLGRRLPPPP